MKKSLLICISVLLLCVLASCNMGYDADSDVSQPKPHHELLSRHHRCGTGRKRPRYSIACMHDSIGSDVN